jgi:hypothetical protein
MLLGGVILLTSFAYLGILFAIAYYGDKRADAGRSIVATPYIYALSMAVYATSWTFYGSVGRAAASGVGFLPIYLGPTLMAALFWLVLRKMIRISKANRITSIADFIAARYGKSALLGGLVTVIAMIGIIPYIALQLKAVNNSFVILLQYPQVVMPPKGQVVELFEDTALYVALLLAAFAFLFGTRHLDATERHEGMVAAIAFESLVKLLAFLGVGVFVTFGLYQGFGDIFERAAQIRLLGLADRAVDAVHPVPAAAVPGGGGRERQRAAPAEGDLAVSAVPVRDQHLRAADRLRRAHALLGGPGRRGLLRADAAHGPPEGGPGPVRVHRRAVRGHRHGDRGDHRAVHHDLQRPGDAGAAALEGAVAGVAPRPHGPAAGHTPRRDRADDDAGLRVLPHRRRGARAGGHRPHLVRGGRAVRAGHAGRHVLEARHHDGRAGRPVERLRRVGLHAAAAVAGQVGLAAHLVRRRGAVRRGAAQAVPALRPHRLRQHQPLDVLEHAAQRRRLRGGVAVQPAEHPRPCAGAAVRGRVQGGRARSRAMPRAPA